MPKHITQLLLIQTLRHCKTTTQIHQVHCHVITTGLSSSSLLLTTVLHSFTAALLLSPPPSYSSSLSYTAAIFHTIKNPSTFCYNTIIRAHTILASPHIALLIFARMRRLSIPPDTHTYPFAIKACSHIRCPSLSRTLHCQALKFGFTSDVFVVNCLVYSYSVLGLVCDGCSVFDESPQRDVVSYNTLIDGFVKAGEIDRACGLFEGMGTRDCVSWGTLISGYAKVNRFSDAIEMYSRMVRSGFRPDNVALVSALSACAQLGELEKGKRIHEYVKRDGLKIDAYLSTALVDLYAKCGYIETALEIFELSPEKALFTWNAMLTGLAMHGRGVLMLDYFSKMAKSGIGPDGVTFLVILVGCSHAGLVDEAKCIYNDMEDVYRVRRELKHYGCMVDLLGRAGLIREAMDMIECMPINGDVYVWGGLLSGCRIHGDFESAEKAADQVMEIKPEDGGAYSIMANIYANTERWDAFTRTRRLRDSTGVKKKAGCSLIELNGITHEFVAGDELHPQTGALYLVLDAIGKHQFESL